MYVGGNCRWVLLTLVFCHSCAQCKGIRIQESGIHVPLKKNREYSTWNLESTTWNPESTEELSQKSCQISL